MRSVILKKKKVFLNIQHSSFPAMQWVWLILFSSTFCFKVSDQENNPEQICFKNVFIFFKLRHNTNMMQIFAVCGDVGRVFISTLLHFSGSGGRRNK